MSCYQDPNPRILITCPYDPAHQIRATRMPYHLAKCKKNHPGENHETCPFNARHVVLKSDYRYHIENCPDKAIIERDMAYDNEIIWSKPAVVNSENAAVPDDFAENWDLSPPVLPPVPHVHPAVESNPELKAKYDLMKLQNPGLQFNNTTGMKPSEKRLHRERVRLEAEEVQNGLSPGTSASPAIVQNGKKESEAQPVGMANTKSFSAAVQQIREPKTTPTKKNEEAAARLPTSTRIAANTFGNNPPPLRSPPAVPQDQNDSAAILAAWSRGRGMPLSCKNGFSPLGRGAGFPTYPPTTGISPLGRGAGCYVSANGAVVGSLNNRPPPGFSGVFGAITPLVQKPVTTENNCGNNGYRID